MIEEGLTTAFSEDMIEEWCGNTDKQAYTPTQKYIDAASRAREPLDLTPDTILWLRAVRPAFNKMTAYTFASAGLNVHPALVVAQLAKFPKY
ncbi:hypothetical protein [Kosakonia sp. S42]|uniref:hypothetical protein n=1 Tax=Kosakonia sp. S42 TaxID=2767458 RepID=UPI00190DE37F|nr:hypothetical protein [Kosakonia sp. S42]MBK0019157.1 hypothetical protein [Kosakonia sp. S42]